MPRSSRYRVFRLSVGTAALAGGFIALSAPREASAQSGPPPPPAEAFTACDSKAEGDACSVQFHEHTIAGTCSKHPADARLFCRPAGPPPPPPEAFDACTGKNAADACTVSLAGHTMTGTCLQSRDARLFCAPPHPPSDLPR